MDTTILGIIALAIGAIWKAFPFLQKWIPFKLPTEKAKEPKSSDAPAGPEKIGRLEALKQAELLLRYLEQNELVAGQQALREVVTVLFTTPGKE